MALVVLLFGLVASSQVAAQVTIGMGGSYQHLTLGSQAYDVSGYSLDIGVKTSNLLNFITRIQHLGYGGTAERDPIHLTSLEIGAQYVSSRGRPLQLGLGIGVGAYVQDQYDAGGAGASVFGQARLGYWPAKEVGVFVETVGRALGGGTGGTAAGLSFGILLGVNH